MDSAFFLIKRGVRALRQRKIRPEKLLIVPSIFLLWSVHDVITQIPIHTLTILLFVGSFIAGFIFLWSINHFEGKNAAYDSYTKTLTLPGNPKILILILIAFSVKYLFSVQLSLHPDIITEKNFSFFFVLVSGLIDGAFWGNIAPILYLLFKQGKSNNQ